jgi:hypothetical protein
MRRRTAGSFGGLFEPQLDLLEVEPRGLPLLSVSRFVDLLLNGGLVVGPAILIYNNKDDDVAAQQQ